jgi:hypothetical protein
MCSWRCRKQWAVGRKWVVLRSRRFWARKRRSRPIVVVVRAKPKIILLWRWVGMLEWSGRFVGVRIGVEARWRSDRSLREKKRFIG